MIRISIALATALVTAGITTACVEQQSLQENAGLPAGRSVSADDLLIVDCLLPGQVRQLGTQMTYLSARRPIQTTAQDCQIRGGEYVAYDRASYASALQVWLPAAEQGDPDAQNKLGEIYERGLGGKPDFAMAAVWYRRAAEQDFSRAQINLGFLYEKGLGVPKDLKLALEWYRKASQLPDAVMIDQSALQMQQAELAALKRELNESRSELERARRALRDSEQRLRKQRERLRQELDSKPQADLDAGERRRVDESRDRLAEQRLELARREEQIRRLEQQSRQQQDRLLLLETEGASLKEQLSLVQGQLQRSQQDLRRYQDLTSENEAQLAQTRADLAAMADARNSDEYQRLRELQEQLRDREASLREQERMVGQLQLKTADLEQRLAASDAADRAELEAVRAQLSQSRAELDAGKALVEQREAALAQTEDQLRAQRKSQDEKVTRIALLETQLKEREQALAEQKSKVAELRAESEQWRQKLSQLKDKQQATGSPAAARTAAAEVPSAAPSIQLIEPPLVGVRGEGDTRIPIKRGLTKRTVIGQVTAPGGLYALTINGARTKSDSQGLFETDIGIVGDVTPVSMVAIDAQGRRSTLAFTLVMEGGSGNLVARPKNPLEDVEIGGFYALVIGNQEYQTLPDLDTAKNDAKKVAAVLRKRFGFKVTLLLDANRYQILSALNRLRTELTEKDNLLLYYAGHGELDRVNLRGHWLPVDAEIHSNANWISNVAITDILNAMAVRHALLVVDSCYSGALTRSALTQLESGQSWDARKHWLKAIAKMRSRTVLTSGGLSPVLDGGGGAHSVFAKALLGVLGDVQDVTEGQRIYREVAARVAFEANRYQVEQVPEYAPIKFAGHESGDFLFVPATFIN
jgi:TPR repeat protein